VFNPNRKAKEEFEREVTTASSATPKMLAMGNAWRDPISNVHDAYHNMGRVAYHRRRVLSEKSLKNEFGAIVAWNKNLPERFLQRTVIQGDTNCIVLCTDFMANLIPYEFRGIALQTDTIHKAVSIAEIDAYLCCTSGYSPTLRKYTPLFASIFFGQTAEHFEIHFDYLFSLLKLKEENGELKDFGGMTCDFSTAELNGFKAAFLKHFPQLNPLEYFHTCEVHFKRSLTRVQRINSVIPSAHKDTFYIETLRLLSITELSAFENAVEEWKMKYPNALNWIDWYLSPSRRESVFAVYRNNAVSGNSKNTNAQEGIGSDLKRCLPVLPCPLGKSLQTLNLYFENIKREHESVKKGIDISYTRTKTSKKRKTPYVNDGRAPDTTDTLKKREAGPRILQIRRRGMTNR
jgi:hypothetical protein